MTADDKLARIRAIIQIDPGHRGLGRVAGENLFTACVDNFAAACHSIADHDSPAVELVTGFYIPGAEPPAFETDGPLGSWFLARALGALGIPATIRAEPPVLLAIGEHLDAVTSPTHRIAVERSGPAADGEHYTMRGLPISAYLDRGLTKLFTDADGVITIGIGDGGNEIGMGKISNTTVVANIPGGSQVHCQVATDYLIVAGVSNWGAYALAAGVTILRGRTWPREWTDGTLHRDALTRQVARGPLVDGVRNRFEPTVDGLDWMVYHDILAKIAEVVDE